MEIQFQKNIISHLQTILRQQQKQEQTQQIRIPDSMPDIGRVLGCWGQVLIRGKEWRSDCVGISGGIMAWVLYLSDDDSVPCCIDTWIPFQMKWDIEETERDGILEVTTTLCHMDARMLSDRKLMVRADVGIQILAAVPVDTELYLPGEISEDIQVLQYTYPMVLPAEAGEKQIDIMQQLEIPSDCARMHKLVHFSAQPVLAEYKVVADKLVLRGNVEVYTLYMDEFGKLQRNSWQLPFSQYTQLDGEYPADSEVEVCFVLTQMEMELPQPDMLDLKLSFAAQYMVLSKHDVVLARDMYSLKNELKLMEEQLTLPSVLENKKQTIRGEASLPDGQILDVAMYLELPQMTRSEDQVEIVYGAMFQILYEDPDGDLKTATEHWQKRESQLVSSDVDYQVILDSLSMPMVEGNITSEIQWKERSVATASIPAVTRAELGEQIVKDSQRPSIILRRAAGESLWEIARSTGSTVEKIQKANELQREPEENQILLIPVN